MAMMCCNPSGIALGNGGMASGFWLMVRVGFVFGSGGGDIVSLYCVIKHEWHYAVASINE
jgi:hypothetical protein